MNLKDGGKIYGCHAVIYGGAIYSFGDKGIINIEEGGKIFNCTAESVGVFGVPRLRYEDPLVGGGAICCEKGKILMSGGKIDGCKVNLDQSERLRCFLPSIENQFGAGGAVVLKEAVMEMTGGQINDCYATAAGGAICCRKSSNLIITNGTISNCSVVKEGIFPSGKGNAIYVDETSELSLSDKVKIKLKEGTSEEADSDLVKTKGYKGIWLEDGAIFTVTSDANNNNNNNQGVQANQENNVNQVVNEQGGNDQVGQVDNNQVRDDNLNIHINVGGTGNTGCYSWQFWIRRKH